MTTTANAKLTITPEAQKKFNKDITVIKGAAEGLAAAIHSAGLVAIAQVNEHGNTGFGTRLMEAMGKKHNRQRVVNWLVKFGKFGVKNNALVFRNRKDITPQNMGAMLEKAANLPYWELTPEQKLVERVDYLSLLHSMLNKHKGMEAKEAAGKQVEERNIGLLPELQALFDKFSKPAAPEVKNEMVVTG